MYMLGPALESSQTRGGEVVPLSIMYVIAFLFIGVQICGVALSDMPGLPSLVQIMHPHDFFGGAFAPDFIFNRLGPLMLASYSSMLLECSCIFFVWPRATRIPTVISMIMLHIGIELAMNMHCFEWLSILGWLMFLVEEPLQTSEKIVPRLPVRGVIGRFFINVFLVAVLTIFLVDTAPLSQFEVLAPKFALPVVKELVDLRDVAIEELIDPYLTPVGLYQGVWSMFAGAPDQDSQYEVVIQYENGTETSWLSPDWSKMTWYEKKRFQRPMSFYDNFGTQPPVVWDAFTRYWTNVYGPNVVSAELILHLDTPPDPPADLGWFEPARQPMERESEVKYTINICDDLHDECEEWADKGLCDDTSETFHMVDKCRRSCDFCVDVDDVAVDDRISVFWESYDRYYDTKVNVIFERPKRFLLEYEVYETDEERFEWVDAFTLRRRRFRLLARDAGEGMEAGDDKETDSEEINADNGVQETTELLAESEGGSDGHVDEL